MAADPDRTAPECAGLIEGQIVVIGATTTALRLVEELEKSGERVLVVMPGQPDPGVAHDLTASGAEVVASGVVREAQLRAAAISRASSVVVLGQDDVEVMRIALLVEELAPAVPMVVEMSTPTLSEAMSSLLGNTTVLSAAQLAAPSFVAAALSDGQVESFEIAGRPVVAGTRSRVGGQTLARLGDSAATEEDQLLYGGGDIVLGTEVLPSARPRARQSGLLGAFVHVFDRRLRWVISILIVLVAVSVVYFHFFGHLDWWLALYAALTASTLSGIADVGELSLSARFGAVAIQLVGLVLSSGITAVIVDALISARLGSLVGSVRGRPKHHVVLCGLGRVGSQIAMRLRAQEVPVVVIEKTDDTLAVVRARQQRIPVIIADAADRTVLEQAGIADAEAVLAVTDSDAANLEIAMVAHQARPDVRVVTRLFDHELATRVEHRLGLGATRSVSMLAAPTFAAAALGHRVDQVVAVGRRVVVLTEIEIEDTPAVREGISLADLAQPHRVVPLALRRTGEQTWSWQPQSAGQPAAPEGQPQLHPGDTVAVAASHYGLADLIARVQLHEGAHPAQS